MNTRRDIIVPNVIIRKIDVKTLTSKYFMVFGPEAYPQRFPQGNDDNTHFQPEGAEAVARMVWEGLVEIAGKK